MSNQIDYCKHGVMKPVNCLQCNVDNLESRLAKQDEVIAVMREALEILAHGRNVTAQQALAKAEEMLK